MGKLGLLLRPRRCNACESLFCVCSHCDRGQRYCSDSAGDKHDDSNDVLPIVATSKTSLVDKRTGYVNLPTDDAGVDAA